MSMSEHPDISEAALTALILKGISREAAEQLIDAAGYPSAEDNLEEWDERVSGRPPSQERRKQILTEHHKKGLPPLEPPPFAE